MTSRHEHLQDIAARLTGSIGDINIWLSRVKTLDVDQLPAICLYAPEEQSGEVEARGAAPQFRPHYHLTVEVRVREADGFDTEAGRIIELVKKRLFCDPVWLSRFDRYPTWHINQFLDRRGEQTFCGEVLVIAARDRLPIEFPPVAATLDSVTATARLGDNSIIATLAKG